MEYKIKGEYIQLNQLLKILRISNSGGQAKLMIEDGEVEVNGKKELRIRAKLFVGDKIQIFENLIEIV